MIVEYNVMTLCFNCFNKSIEYSAFRVKSRNNAVYGIEGGKKVYFCLYCEHESKLIEHPNTMSMIIDIIQRHLRVIANTSS